MTYSDNYDDLAERRADEYARTDQFFHDALDYYLENREAGDPPMYLVSMTDIVGLYVQSSRYEDKIYDLCHAF
jgi:hypothetical protein